MKDKLKKFINLEIRKEEIGENLHRVKLARPAVVRADDVAAAVKAMYQGKISKEHLLEWVNAVWFTDVFDFSDSETDSVFSVLEILEAMDEDGVSITLEHLEEMTKCLQENREYKHF